ncbi:hypothetical protein Tco_1134466 [Tanacetum coccineum]
MSSITAQQAKLYLELVPKEKRLEIGNCNGRLNPGKIQTEPTFQVVLDALALIPCYFTFLITADVLEVYMHQFWDSVYKHESFYRFKMDKRKICPRDGMHQPWRTFAVVINRSLSGKITGLDKLRLSRAQILWGMYHQKNVDYVELLWEDFIYQIDNRAYKKNKIGMHTSKDDYLINTLRCLSAKEATQIYGVVLPESLTSPEMKETKAYKTYLSFAIGSTPPKKERKFKKPASPQLSTVPVSPEEPMGKSKRVKKPTKKSTKAPARGVVIRETPEMPLSKKKEKMTAEKREGIDLLSEVALTKEAQYEEVRRKSLMDFYKTHPSGSGTVTKTAPSAAKIKPSITNEGTCVKPGVLDVTEEESSESEVESWGNDEDDSNNDHDLSGEDSDQENDSDDDKTQSDNENESDFEHETDENESEFESDQEENE